MRWWLIKVWPTYALCSSEFRHTHSYNGIRVKNFRIFSADDVKRWWMAVNGSNIIKKSTIVNKYNRNSVIICANVLHFSVLKRKEKKKHFTPVASESEINSLQSLTNHTFLMLVYYRLLGEVAILHVWFAYNFVLISNVLELISCIIQKWLWTVMEFQIIFG